LTRLTWPRVSEVNLTGTLLGVQALTPLMTDGGSIIVVGSIAALTGHYPVACTASKWALRGLAKAACLELGRRGIRVNTIHPGYIETPMTASASPAFLDANIAGTPLGRPGTFDEVAPLVVFLISERRPSLPAPGPRHSGLRSPAAAG
jgi:NAD(P)-dependent dehydrogenase (short-subunit alcohol dehydrogenase family)